MTRAMQSALRDWAVITPDGRFDKSPSFQGLHFVVDETHDVIELEQLKSRFYEPGVWSKATGHSAEPLRKIPQRLKKGTLPLRIHGGVVDDSRKVLTFEAMSRGGGH